MKEDLESADGSGAPCVTSVDGDTPDQMQAVLELPPLLPRNPGGEGSEVAMGSSDRDLLQELANTEPLVSVEQDFYNQWARAPRQPDAPPLPPPPLAARATSGPCPRDRTRVVATPARGVRPNLKPLEGAGISQNGEEIASKACQTGDSKETPSVDLLPVPPAQSTALPGGDLVPRRSAPPRHSRISEEKSSASIPLNPVKPRKYVSSDVDAAEKTVTLVYPPRTPAYGSRTPMQPNTPSFPMMDALEYISERLSLRSAGESGRASGEAALPLDQQRRAMSRSQNNRRSGTAKPPSLTSPTSAAPKPPATAPGGHRLVPTTAASIPSGHPIISHSSSSGSVGSVASLTWTSGRFLSSPNPVASSSHPTSANSFHNSSRSSSYSDPPFAPGSLPVCPQTSPGRLGHFVSLKPCTGSGGYPVIPKTPSTQASSSSSSSSSAPVVPSTLGVVDFLELRQEHMPVRANSSSHRQHNFHRLHQYQQYFRSHRPRTHNIQLSRAALLHQRPGIEGKGMQIQGRRSSDEQGSARGPFITIPTGHSKPDRGSDECLISVKIKVRNCSKNKT